MRRARFVGGPLHGEIRALRDYDGYLQVPVMDYKPYSTSWVGKEINPDSLYSTVIYERRTIQLGPFVRTEVWAPRDMSEPALMRRIADLIEGDIPPENR